MRMCTEPNLFKAVFTIVSPSSTEHTAAAALPPADSPQVNATIREVTVIPTFHNLINNTLRCFFTDVVHHNISPELAIHQGIGASETSAGTRDNYSLSVEPDLGR